MHVPLTSLFFFALLFVGACAPTVEVTPLGALPTMRSPEPVQVFMNSDTISRPYREVALITVNDDGWGRSEGELLELLLARAHKIGAEGIIVLNQEVRSAGGVLVPTGYSLTYVDSSERVVRGSAIVFTD